jgi:CDP-glucose 4,6-dehydratase
MLDQLPSFNGRSVLITGHTGFKGSWLALWLHRLGARVTGYALDPPSTPNHFRTSEISRLLHEDTRADIRDTEQMRQAVERCRPDLIFHLAAQPIVRTSLASPLETFDVNVVGTASVLDAVRLAGNPCAVVVATSDKCYRNDGQVWGFRESDPLGGHDPYSASKAGSELVVDSYRSSYFHPQSDGGGVRLASVRAGNVIGGGDWAEDRIVPDAVRALASSHGLTVRNPAATRPWQHVLEPLSGYLAVASRLLESDDPSLWAEAWNFGPLPSGEATVGHLADAIIASWGSGSWVGPPVAVPTVEAHTLRIAIDKAVVRLGWRPTWDFEETVSRTVRWYKSYYDSTERSTEAISIADIEAYEDAERETRHP